MQDLNPAQLTTVVGGTSKNDQITQQITALQSSLKDAISSKDNNGGGNQTFMMLALMMALRPAPTVVAAGGPPPRAAAPSSVVNISTRVRA